MTCTNQVVLLCGGRGTRLGKLTDIAPKPGLIIGGKPWLDRVIEEYARHDLRKFLLVTGYKGDQIAQMYSEWGIWRGLQIEIYHEDAPHGTLPALRAIVQSDLTENRFLLANGDTLLQTDTRPQNFSGNRAFTIGRKDCGLRLFNTMDVANTLKEVPEDKLSIEQDFLPVFKKLKWAALNKDESRFIDIGTPADFERAKVIFR